MLYHTSLTQPIASKDCEDSRSLGLQLYTTIDHVHTEEYSRTYDFICTFGKWYVARTEMVLDCYFKKVAISPDKPTALDMEINQKLMD